MSAIMLFYFRRQGEREWKRERRKKGREKEVKRNAKYSKYNYNYYGWKCLIHTC